MRRFPRTPPRLDRVIPNNPVFFVTFCTYRRKPLLATDVVNQALIDFAARAYADHNIAVGRYVIMPDHIHLFVCGPDNFELGGWVGMLKQCVEKQIVRDTSGEPLWPLDSSITCCGVRRVTRKVELRARQSGAGRSCK
jgi:putative transposase